MELENKYSPVRRMELSALSEGCPCLYEGRIPLSSIAYPPDISTTLRGAVLAHLDFRLSGEVIVPCFLDTADKCAGNTFPIDVRVQTLNQVAV